MMEMLRKYTEDGYDDWEEMLGHVAFAYRHSVNSSTQETPYFLNHGRDAVMPIDMFLTPYSKELVTPQDYKSLTMKRLFDAFQLVKQNLETIRQASKGFQISSRRQVAVRRPCSKAWYKQKTVSPLPRPISGNQGSQ